MINDTSSLYKEKTDDYYALERSEIIPFIPTRAETILDVGCGDGGFGKTLKANRSAEIWGIEPNQLACQKAALYYDKVIHGIFDNETSKLIDGKLFDCITFNDVLEHLINPEEALLTAKKHLKKEGVIVASIPNILFFEIFFNQIIVKEDWKYDKHGILDETHLRFFTKTSIIRLFENSGYDIVKIQGINPYSSRKYKILNAVLFNKLKDWKYLQFAVIAKIK